MNALHMRKYLCDCVGRAFESVRPFLLAFYFLFALLLSFLIVVGVLPASEEYERAMYKLSAAKTAKARFYALGEAAKQSFNHGYLDDARRLANELLEVAQRNKNDWCFGNAIHDGNMILGRIALRHNRIDESKACLLEAANTPGSPQLDSFGPNMGLAK